MKYMRHQAKRYVILYIVQCASSDSNDIQSVWYRTSHENYISVYTYIHACKYEFDSAFDIIQGHTYIY